MQATYFGDVPELYFTKWYEEQTGVTVEWELFPQASIEERVGLMMSSPDTLPDAAMGLDFSPSEQVNYGATQGFFLPLQDYIEDIGVFTKEVYTEEILNEITAPDGNIYALPASTSATIAFTQARPGSTRNGSTISA